MQATGSADSASHGRGYDKKPCLHSIKEEEAGLDVCLLLEPVRLNKVKRDDAANPNNDHDDSQAVEVLFHNGGTGQVRLNATTEQARQTATFALVQKNGNRHEQACNDEDDLKCQGHERTHPFRCWF